MNVQGVVFQNVIMHLTYLVMEERKIDHITPGWEKINLGPKRLPRQWTLSFKKENLTDKTGTPANLITFWFNILLILILSISWIWPLFDVRCSPSELIFGFIAPILKSLVVPVIWLALIVNKSHHFCFMFCMWQILQLLFPKLLFPPPPPYGLVQFCWSLKKSTRAYLFQIELEIMWLPIQIALHSVQVLL